MLDLRDVDRKVFSRGCDASCAVVFFARRDPVTEKIETWIMLDDQRALRRNEQKRAISEAWTALLDLIRLLDGATSQDLQSE